MAERALFPRRFLPDSRFNWVYPVDLVVAIIVAVFFLFYFNRVFASIISYAIRRFTWYRYRVYIDFEALQFSPLAGRVFFKGFRYHGRNETILVHDGYITWRYWLRRVKTAGVISKQDQELSSSHEGATQTGDGRGVKDGESGGKRSRANLPCRITVKIRGLEWYIYNRSPAYDTIAESIFNAEKSGETITSSNVRRRNKLDRDSGRHEVLHEKAHPLTDLGSVSSVSGQQDEQAAKAVGYDATASRSRATSSSRPSASTSSSSSTAFTSLPAALQALPIKLECTKGAIVLGNHHTRSVLVAKFESANGEVDALHTSPRDLYKQTIDFEFTLPIVLMKANKDFRESQISAGARTSPDDRTGSSSDAAGKAQQKKETMWNALRSVLPHVRQSTVSLAPGRRSTAHGLGQKEGLPGESRWLGLTRYMDDEDDLLEQERWKSVEYGRFPTILDSPSVGVTVRWDVPGMVTQECQLDSSLQDTAVDVNGAEPPDWSIDLRIRGGEIHYGPWADRQRIDLQNAFFPALYKDATPAVALKLGESRISTLFKLLIEVEERTTFVIHTREESKDWKWKGRATTKQGPDTQRKGRKHRAKRKKGVKDNPNPEARPYGWLDFKVARDSTVNFSMDLVAGSSGYRNNLVLDLREPEMLSSVNHELLWKSKAQVISCDLSNPLAWNSLRRWTVDVRGNGLDVFLLRDHIFLLTDVVNDWASGPAGDYYTFVPFNYSINLQLQDFKLFVNANDSNIINNPSDIDDNTFVVIWGKTLSADVNIPLQHYRPSRNEIAFEAAARDGKLELCTPPWNTQHAFLDDNKVASLKRLTINGSYSYHSTTSPSLTDVLRMELYGDSPAIHLYGFLIRYLMNIKDNYFGEDMHFKTLEEYQGQLKDNNLTPDAMDHGHHAKVSNDLDVILKVVAEQSVAMLPARLYSTKECIGLEVSTVVADLRFTNYYMDLSVSFSPISIARAGSPVWDSPSSQHDSGTQIFLDGLELFGHRLFGLPPTEPTYVCNWDFDIGSITGQCSVGFLRSLLLGLRCFLFSFDDDENALPPLNPPVIHDVTFLRMNVKPIELWLKLEKTALLLRTKGITLEYNDWARARFSDRLKFHVSELTVADVEVQEVPKDSKGLRTVYAYIGATIDLRMLKRKSNFGNELQLQQNHLKINDSRTHRTPWLILDPNLDPSVSANLKIRPPAMQFPPMPEPCLNTSASSMSSSSSSTSSYPELSRKQSFLTHRFSKEDGAANLHSDPLEAHRSSLRHFREDVGQRAGLPLDTETGTSRGSLAQSGLTFSSPYKPPHFPLCGTVIDLEDVPLLPEQPQRDTRAWYDEPREQLEDPFDQGLENGCDESTSFIVQMTQGLRALCTPSAVTHVQSLVNGLQPDDPLALLDSAHVDTITKVLPSLKNNLHQGKMVDLNLRVPVAQARFMLAPTPQLAASQDRRCLEIRLDGLNTTTRSSEGHHGSARGSRNNSNMFHVALDTVSCSMIDLAEHPSSNTAAVRCNIFEPVVWLANSGRAVIDVQLRDFEVVAKPTDIERTAELGLEEYKKAKKIADDIVQHAKETEARLRYFVHSLVSIGDSTVDPPFLTRPSYVLRSTRTHLRTSDSWKMLSRLRQIYQSLRVEVRNQLMERLFHNPKCPADATARVIENFERWQAFDVTKVKESILMRRIFGNHISPQASITQPSQALQASLRVGSLRIVVDTRPHQNEFAVERLAVMVEHMLPTNAKISRNRDHSATSKVQIHCTKVAAYLNWALCGIFADAMAMMPSDAKDVEIRTASEPVQHKLHVVVSFQTCILKIDSPNLVNTSLCEGLGLSVLVSAAEPGLAVNLLLSANVATSETQDHSRNLVVSRFRGPSIFASLDRQIGSPNHAGTWSVAACCNEIVVKSLEDPIYLMEVIDVCVRNEVSDIVNTFALTTKQKSEDKSSKSNPSSQSAHVTLFVDSYLISVAALPTLSYRVRGRAARSTVRHGLRYRSETRIDFDLKGHSHSLATVNREVTEEVACMELPPINGCLDLNLDPERQSVVIQTMVENILVNASAVHALLVVASRPEISNLIANVQRELVSLRSHVEEVFPNSKAPPKQPSTNDSTLLYDAQLIIAGFGISAISPTSSAATRAGQLHFNLGSLQIKTTNRESDSGPILEFAETELRLKSIRGSLLRIDNSEEHPNGDMAIAAVLRQTSRLDTEKGKLIRAYQASVTKFEVNVNAETPTMIIDILGHLQDTLKTIDLSPELGKIRALGRSRYRSTVTIPEAVKASPEDPATTVLFGAMYSLEMTNIQLTWKIGRSTPISPGREAEDLILSFTKIELSTKRENAARLLIENFQLEMVPTSKAAFGRSLNSALLPEVVFNVAYLSTAQDRRLAFQAAGKSLDLRLSSKFILPASDLRRSIAFAVQEVRGATANWNASAVERGTERKNLLGDKKFASILVDADFAGAEVYIQGRSVEETQLPASNVPPGVRMHGRYNQFTPENTTSNTTLRAPGLAFKIEYQDASEKSLKAEVKVDASSNELHPAVVPLVMEISSSVKEMVSDSDSPRQEVKAKPAASKFIDDERLRSADPSAIFGSCRVNLGLRICKQEFSLTCQPIARVAAVARFENIYMTVNTVHSTRYGQFYTLSAAFSHLRASVQHAYSRDSTGSLEVESVFVSLMSSKHVSDAGGLSAILKVSPIKAQINARQLQDFLLFREIWIPPEVRHSHAAHVRSSFTEPQAFIVQRYQQVASAGAFPWNATASVAQLEIQLDLGQSLGRTSFSVSKFWVSSKKSSDWEQNLCLGFDGIGVDSVGRMSGVIELQNFRVRTSIQWPMIEKAHHQTPLVQASVAFEHLRVKAAFEYQAFAIANITSVDFLMYNVRDLDQASNDRLVCIVRGDKVQAFCTATKKQAAYQTSLKDIERFLRRRSAVVPLFLSQGPGKAIAPDPDGAKLPIRLQTEVIARLGAVNFGVFPGTFFDNQVFKVEALNASAQFSVVPDHEKIRSNVGLTLGQLRVALSGVTRPNAPRKVGEVAIDDVVTSATGSRGGTILKVPRVVAAMQTWQLPESTQIDYTFTSSFQGNIDVGWNYSRISFLRGMFANHSRALAQRLGKPLPQSAVQITGGPRPEGEGGKAEEGGEQEKITAVVNVPLSKYQYTALQEPVIDTPKLTQLGDATPPLEWIGLHRERLPNLTHQIVIVSLLEVAKEVEDAYARILGSS
ncbi:MAG: hypothetical protein Q9191_004856 [Dirinaria sp. TL-2023a]